MAQQAETVVQINLEELVPDRLNRKIGGFNPEKLKQLADSIRAVGVQQPAVVRKMEGLTMEGLTSDHGMNYEIVAGERRWRAAKIAGLKTLPCVVRELDDMTVLKIRTIENLQREDIHPLDEAEGYARLMDQAGYGVDNLAQEVGRSASYVYQRLKLRDLIPPAKELLMKGKIAAGQAILIARLQPAQQKEVLTHPRFRFRDEGPSVRELDEFIREHVLMDLSKTSFQKDDAGLVPKAGPCTSCQKRTGFQPALFADVCKRDYCTDPACFEAKLNSLVARRRAELAKETHLLVREGYGTDKNIPKEALEHYNWQECKAKDKGAIRCLVVDGAGRGRLTWGLKQEGYHHEKTPQEKAAEKRKKVELQAKRDARRQLWEKIFKKLENRLTYPDCDQPLPLGLRRLIVANAWDRLWDNHRVLLAKVEGWQTPKKRSGYYGNGRVDQGKVLIEKMFGTGLLTFMIKIALVHDLEVNEYDRSDAKDLHEAARALGLDPKAAKAKARKAAKGRRCRHAPAGTARPAESPPTVEAPASSPGLSRGGPDWKQPASRKTADKTRGGGHGCETNTAFVRSGRGSNRVHQGDIDR